MSARVLGLDLSLTSTGVAHATAAAIIKRPPMSGAPDLDRLRWMAEKVAYTVEQPEGTPWDLVVIEGPSYGNQGTGRQTGHHVRAGLWWIVVDHIDGFGVPYAVVSPASLKKYAAGKGGASKDAVLVEAARRFPNFALTNDAADALWLAAMGHDHLGTPLVTMPAANRKALEAVPWPPVGERPIVDGA